MFHRVVIALTFLFGIKSELLFASTAKNFTFIMKEFMQGFFDYYDLPFPFQIISCYTEKGTETFFDLLQVSYQLGQDLLEGDTDSYRPMVDSLEELYEDVTPFYFCQWQTEDWESFLFKLNPSFRMPNQTEHYLRSMSKLLKLYTDGQLVEWSILLASTKEALTIGDYYQAGFEYASAFNKSGLFQNNDALLEYLKLEAFDMGFLLAMGLTYEDSSIFCYTKEAAETSVEWFYQLAKTVMDADIENITGITEEFFKTTSKEIKDRLPEQVELCLASTPGTGNFIKKFGLDPQVPVFPYAFTYYSKKRPEPFYNSMTYIWEKFDGWDYLGAGVAFGDFLKDVINNYNYRAR